MVQEKKDIAELLSNLSDEERSQLISSLSGGKSDEPPAEPAQPGLVARAKDALRVLLGGDVSGRIPARALADALLQFKFLHSSGCEMLRTLEILENSRNPLLKKLFGSVRDDVENGLTLADAFEKFESRVGSVVVSTVRAAEESGTLSESLEFLADNINRDEELRERVRRAISYPLTTAFLTFTIFFLCVLFVVPQFQTLSQKGGLNARVTGVSGFVFGLSDFMRNYYWFWIPLVLVVVLVLIRLVKNNPEAVDAILLRIPLVNKLLTLSNLARFFDRLGVLLASGVSLLKSIKLAKETVANRVLRPRFARMSELAESGQSLSETFVDIPNVPDNVVDMIRVGEDAGALPETLAIGAENIRKEMDRLYDRLTRWIQPIGILIVSALVLLLVIALFVPYLDMLESISLSGETIQGMPGN